MTGAAADVGPADARSSCCAARASSGSQLRQLVVEPARAEARHALVGVVGVGGLRHAAAGAEGSIMRSSAGSIAAELLVAAAEEQGPPSRREHGGVRRREREAALLADLLLEVAGGGEAAQPLERIALVDARARGELGGGRRSPSSSAPNSPRRSPRIASARPSCRRGPRAPGRRSPWSAGSIAVCDLSWSSPLACQSSTLSRLLIPGLHALPTGDLAVAQLDQRVLADDPAFRVFAADRDRTTITGEQPIDHGRRDPAIGDAAVAPRSTASRPRSTAASSAACAGRS